MKSITFNIIHFCSGFHVFRSDRPFEVLHGVVYAEHSGPNTPSCLTPPADIEMALDSLKGH